MSGIPDIRLLGFTNFEASKRFLHALDNDIWISRWGRPKPSVHRPDDIDTTDAMRAELQQPSLITVVSAHAGYFDVADGRHIGFCGDGDKPVLLAASIGILGAASMLLIDACWAPDLAASLKGQPGSLIVGLDHEPGCDPVTQGRDSVTVIGAVIRELCYPAALDLSPERAAWAVDIVKVQTSARNNAETKRGVTNKEAKRPLLRTRKC